jgi:hypothetical protein
MAPRPALAAAAVGGAARDLAAPLVVQAVTAAGPMATVVAAAEEVVRSTRLAVCLGPGPLASS